MNELDAFYTALEANPTNWLLYGIFADWLDEHREFNLAEGFRAMGRLKVCVEVKTPYKGIDAFERDTYVFIRERRELGNYHLVTNAWYISAISGQPRSFRIRSNHVALAYSKMPSIDKVFTERILTCINEEIERAKL